MRTLIKTCLLGFVLTGSAVTPAAGQEITNDRFNLSPLRIQYGHGSIRLEGMGGFITAVPDENNEINVNDFAENPAGFGDDRDAWVMETRYSHREFSQPVVFGMVENGDGEMERVSLPVPFGVQDLRSREAVVSFGRYKPGHYGAGVQVDVGGARALARSDYDLRLRDLDYPSSQLFDVVNFRFLANSYLSSKFTVGASFDVNSESATNNTRNYYDIDHDSSGLRGGLGAALQVLRGVTVGGKGELVGNQIDGVSESGNHRDEFSWERPTSIVAGHVLINRGRLDLGVDYTSKDVSGFEDVVTSWSARFTDNPGDEEITQTLDTFSEDRTADQLRARGMINVSRNIHVSAMYVDQDTDFQVVSIPNARGSVDGQDVTQSNELTALGVGWKLMDNRLLLAGERVTEVSDLEVTYPDVRRLIENRNLEISTLRIGGEFFLGETTLIRAGLINETQTVKIRDYARGGAPSVSSNADRAEYDTLRLALGLGLVPKGGILQVDLNLDTVLDSDADQTHTNVGAYLKYLF